MVKDHLGVQITEPMWCCSRLQQHVASVLRVAVSTVAAPEAPAGHSSASSTAPQSDKAPTFQGHGFHLGRFTLVTLQLPFRHGRWLSQVEKRTPAANRRLFHFVLRPLPVRQNITNHQYLENQQPLFSSRKRKEQMIEAVWKSTAETGSCDSKKKLHVPVRIPVTRVTMIVLTNNCICGFSFITCKISGNKTCLEIYLASTIKYS